MINSNFTLDQFKAIVLGEGLAMSDRYEVAITSPRCLDGTAYQYTNKASILADHVQFPPMQVANKRVQIFGVSEPRPVALDYGGDNLGITFLMDNSMQVKDMFDYWIQCIVDVDNALVAYQDDYICDIYIRQLDKADRVTYECLIEGAYPYAQSSLDANAAAAGSVQRLNVGFAYRKWRNTGLPAFGQNATQTKRDSTVKVTVL